MAITQYMIVNFHHFPMQNIVESILIDMIVGVLYKSNATISLGFTFIGFDALMELQLIQNKSLSSLATILLTELIAWTTLCNH